MGKRAIALLLTLLLVGLVQLQAQNSTIVLGKDAGWSDLEQNSNLTVQPGRQGFKDLALGTNEYSVDPKTDVLLHFDTTPITDSADRWTLIGGNISTSTNVPRLGAGAAVFPPGGDGIDLNAAPDSLFGPGTESGSFSIEFWIYSIGGQQDATILSWSGATFSAGKPVDQKVRISITDDRLTFAFSNFFISSPDTPESVVISGVRHLIPRTWHHNLLRFDATTGLMEYLVDGRPEAITYATTTGNEGGTVFLPYAGRLSSSHVYLGTSFHGMIDEFRIEKRVVDTPNLDIVADSRGIAVSRVFDLQYAGTQLANIQSHYNTPGDTAILFFYRMGNRSNGTDVLDEDWTQFFPGTDLLHAAKPVLGRFLQVRAELLPDGPHLLSPSIHSITINYIPDLPPPPPVKLVARPGNGTVTLQWTSVPEADVKGYLVYYGDRPGQYFGTDVAQGFSPIDVGNVNSVTLTGMQNGKLYYFAVAAYDKSGLSHASVLSQEVSARPLRVY